jgi:glycosyltransferase involved in cell wall biosynthesis
MGLKVVIVMPAYNAALTLEKTFNDIPIEYQSNIILVDDNSRDGTIGIARALGIQVLTHSSNLGYGANQKTCYEAALSQGADIVIMLHPDYQYDARVVSVMAKLIELGNCDVVLGNRIRTRQEALSGGMPLWKYLVNRISTLFENFYLGQTLGDFHSGFRAYSREVLETLPYEQNSDDFVFDQEFLIQAVYFDFKLGDIPVPVRYFPESSSINFKRSVKYGIYAFCALVSFRMHSLKVRKDSRFISKKEVSANES